MSLYFSHNSFPTKYVLVNTLLTEPSLNFANARTTVPFAIGSFGTKSPVKEMFFRQKVQLVLGFYLLS